MCACWTALVLDAIVLHEIAAEIVVQIVAEIAVATVLDAEVFKPSNRRAAERAFN